MAFATATVESWTDNPCASWAEGGDQGDVKKSLCSDTTEHQLWLVFSIFMTVYCARIHFFGALRNLLVSVFAEITLAIWWKLLILGLILNKIWNGLLDIYTGCLVLLAHYGTYANSQFLGQSDAIFEQHNPAFGGRGPGFQRRRTGGNDRKFDSTRGFPGEGWSSKFSLFKVVT